MHLTDAPTVLSIPRRPCDGCGQLYSVLRLHDADGKLQCRTCAAGSRFVFLSPRELELARMGWVTLRATAYLALFLWWMRQSPSHPVYGLLSGVFLADISSWMLFTTLALPFRGLRFALEFSLYAALTGFVLRSSPFTETARDHNALGFAALGFTITFSAKAFHFIWQKLIRDA